jgi:broad specificity phosphatase PhoE
MRLFLITHAHTEQLQDVALDIWTLSARGIEQAKGLAEASFWPEVDRVVLSSEQKTWLTVQGVVTERKLPVWIDCRFDELRRGGWVEDYASQVAAAFAEPSMSVGGWECVENVQRRVRAGIIDLQRRFDGETLVLVGHGLCLSILRAMILRQVKVDFAAWQHLSFASWACAGGDPLQLLSDFTLSSVSER